MIRKRLFSTFRGIRVTEFGAPAVLAVDNAIPPLVPNASQVVVNVHAAGINPVDTYIRAGTYAKLPPLPYTPGNDGAGFVEAVGEDVSNVKVGDRVYITRSVSGTYAEKSLCDHSQVIPLPPNVDVVKGAALGVAYNTAYRALFTQCEAKPNETLFVHGASGGVGIAAVQMGRALGMHVIGTAGTEEGMALVREQGAHEVFNHKDPDYLDHISGVHVCVEMLGDQNLEADMKVMAQNGRIGIVGNRGTIEINPRLAMQKELTIRGVMLALTTPEQWQEMHKYIYAGLEAGFLNPVVSQSYDLADAPTAHTEVIEHSKGSQGKIIVRIAE